MTTNNKIDLNTCVPGQNLERRDGALVTYERKSIFSIDYPHLVDGESYTDDGYYRLSRTEDSWDIVKIFPVIKPRPEIDLNTCVPGQKLELRNGDIVEYEGEHECASPYSHKVNGEEYTNDGCYLIGREDSWDVVKILPMKKSEPEIDLNTCVPGQKVKLRNGAIAIYEKPMFGTLYDYPHWISNRSYTNDGKYVVGISDHTYDVVEILPLEKESKPVTDLRTCVPGQKLRLRDGRITTYKRTTGSPEYPHQFYSGGTYTDEGYYWLDKGHSNNDVIEILPMEEEPAKTSTELTHSITDQIDVTSPDHVSIIPHEHGVTISIKKGLTTISWRHRNS